jgi:membrane protease YdiL (CAAX protease family)
MYVRSRSVLLAIVLHAGINFAFGGNGLVVLTEVHNLLALFTVVTCLLAASVFVHLHRTAPPETLQHTLD